MTASSGPILLTGGTGLIGGRILPDLAGSERVRLLTRKPGRLATRSGVEACGWDGVRFPPEALEGAGCVVHLAGEPVFGGLASKRRLARLRSSRIDSTARLVESLAELAPEARPDTLVCASAVGFYGDRGEERLPEGAAAGAGFLADLCRDWEERASRAGELGVRVVKLRFGIVLARDGGALALMTRVFKAGLGGRIGSGRQWFPWVHIDDAARLVIDAVRRTEIEGVVNVVSPNPVRNADLTRILAARLRRPAVVAAPAFAVRAALGPLASELLGSKRVIPERAAALGFEWRHADLEGALAAELGSRPAADTGAAASR